VTPSNPSTATHHRYIPPRNPGIGHPKSSGHTLRRSVQKLRLVLSTWGIGLLQGRMRNIRGGNAYSHRDGGNSRDDTNRKPIRFGAAQDRGGHRRRPPLPATLRFVPTAS